MLTVKFVERKDLTPGLYRDSAGLYLQVSERGTKAWIYRYMILGRARKMGLGGADDIGLKDARELARDARVRVKQGYDPIDERNARRAALAAESVKATTFEQCARDYVETHQHSWKSAKHAKQWITSLENYVFPVIGKLPVAMIDKAHVMKVIQPIWLGKTITADRVRVVSSASWIAPRFLSCVMAKTRRGGLASSISFCRPRRRLQRSHTMRLCPTWRCRGS